MDFYVGLKREYKTLNTIEINRKNLLSNFDYFKRINKNEIWPVLKSNAYGHGLKQVAQILENRKFDYLVVDGYQEVLEIRKITKRPILMIGPIRPENFLNVKWKNLAVMVDNRQVIKKLGKLNKKIRVHLKVNTGMNRQGVEIVDLPAGKASLRSLIVEIKKYKKLEVEGLMSHLAGVDDKKQIKKFEEALKIVSESGLKIKYAHLAATAGVGKIKNPKINTVRLGIGLYGLENEKLKPVLSLKTVITKVRRIKKGEKVSYGGEFIANKDIYVGVIPVGYYECLNRRLGNKGWVKYKNKFYQIAGRVCMNMTVINFDQTKPKLFDEVEVISNNSKDKNSVKNMAKITNTISYEVLAKINPSVRRVVV